MDAYYEFLSPRVSHCRGLLFIPYLASGGKTSLLQVFEVTGTSKRGFKLRLLDQFKLYGIHGAQKVPLDLDYIMGGDEGR